ncbi:hypothetical protein [Vibrio vulnificus]|uniref:hypothetical protein n=1 Tax=Vibrio vulnificus TaxID=672 RepID=UPI001FAFE79D|nr:hypothetical protein [Vibrio vulnificus]MCJ0805501.1 hypothetical protein [Vibrio vulnificus]
MAFINYSNPNENWFKVLRIWERLCNLSHYKLSDREFNDHIKDILVFMYSEKDWIKHECKENDINLKIEDYIHDSVYLKILGDLANLVKHRRENPKRPPKIFAKDTAYFGKVKLSCGASRRYHFIEYDNGKIIEVMEVIRVSLDELAFFKKSMMLALAEKDSKENY